MPVVNHKKHSRGFVLPAVIMVGFAIMILGVTNLGIIASSSTNLNGQYYRQLAKEAADAGASVASGCVKEGQLWTAPLTIQQNCDNTTSGIDAVAQQDNWKSTYEVSVPPSSDPSALTFVSTGTVEFTGSTEKFTATTKTTFKKQTTPSGSLSKNTTEISIGTNSMCAVAEGKAYCWGGNTDGQLGDATATDRSIPVAVSTSLVAIPADPGDCRTPLFGSCVAWNREPTPEIPPSALAGKTVTKIARGTGNHTCAIADGKAYCWGDNDNGQLGNRTKIDSRVPVAVYDSATAIAAYAGNCRTNVFGACIAWNSPPTDAVPASPLAGKTVTDISVGADYSCAIASGDAICWGANGRGQLGTNSRSGLSAPTAVYTREARAAVIGVCRAYIPFTSICINWDPPASAAVPASVMHGKTMVSISVGTYHTCAFDNLNVAYCWGKNEGGQLGNSAVAPPATGNAEDEAESWSLNDGCSGNGSMNGGPQHGPDPTENDELQPVVVDAKASYTKNLWWGGTQTVPASPLNGKTIQSIKTSGNYTGVLADGRVYWFGGPDARSVQKHGTMTVSCVDRTPNGCQNTTSGGANYCSSVRTVTDSIRSKYKEWDYDMHSRAAGPVYSTQTFFGNPISSSNNALTGKSIIQTSGAIFGNDSCGSAFGIFSNSCAGGASEGTFCALTTEQILYCDGPQFYLPYRGNLGTGSPYSSIRFDVPGPRQVKMNGALAGKTITKLVSNPRGDYSCVVANSTGTDNAIYCWGVNYRGRLGNGKSGTASGDHNYEPAALKLDAGSAIGNPGGSSTTTYTDPITF